MKKNRAAAEGWRWPWPWPSLSATIFIILGLALIPGASSDEGCCVPPLSYFDCTGSGHLASPGMLYTCVKTSNLEGCMTCLRNEEYSNVTCTACCSIENNADCASIDSEWEFYASTLFFICLCCCFTALCGFTEVRRKKKGISFAQAWSVPQAMPILQTFPRRSSDSDVNPTDSEGPWAALSDNEDDAKRYPIAGLVDDAGMAFGFVSSMPQSLLSSVANSLGRSPSPAPPEPQEPELTVRVSREPGVSTSTFVSAPSDVETTSGGDPCSRSRGPSRLGRGQQRAVVVGNDLEEPLMLDGTVPTAGLPQSGRANSASSTGTDNQPQN